MGFGPIPADQNRDPENALIWLGSAQGDGLDKNIDGLVADLNVMLASEAVDDRVMTMVRCALW